MGKIFFIMGKSCSGKDTIYKELQKDRHLHLQCVVGYTTRPIRDGEAEGKEYHFVSEEDLENLREQQKVIECREYDTVYGTWSYFTVDDGQIDLDKGNFIYIGTLESFTQMQEYYGKERVVPIYINVEDGIRLERAILREKKQKIPKYVEMCRRFVTDSEDFSEKNIELAGINQWFENNGQLAQCYGKIRHFIEKEILGELEL